MSNKIEPGLLPLNHPSHVWNMEGTPEWEEAIISMTIGLRDWAETPEEIEIYAQLATFMRTILFQNLIDQQKLCHLARLGKRPVVDMDRFREHQEAFERARDPDQEDQPDGT